MDLKNWGRNLAAHSKCFPKLTDFFRIDENLTEIWQFKNLLDFYPFRGVDKVAHFHHFGNNFQIVISQSNFHQFLKSQWVLESILNELQDSNLNSSNPWRFDKVTKVFNHPKKSSEHGYFNCQFSISHNSAKSWSICKKSGIFELLVERTTRFRYWTLNLVKV